jgi:ATP-dependent Clp protease ATP-binding subunit ClpA
VFDLLRDDARNVLREARRAARACGQEWIGTDHLLVGLCARRETAAGDILVGLGVDPEDLRERLDEAMERLDRKVPAKLPFAVRARRALQGALAAATGLGHDFIGTGHLLLGILDVPESTGARVLAGFGVNHARARLMLAGDGAS